MHILTDKGWFSAREILACHEAGITATVPRSDMSGTRSKGHFGKADFTYGHDADICRCPAGPALAHRTATEQQGLQMRRSLTNGCKDCALKSRCTTGQERRVYRWEHGHLVQASNARCRSPSAPMGVRRSTFIYPFGTAKAWTWVAQCRLGWAAWFKLCMSNRSVMVARPRPVAHEAVSTPVCIGHWNEFFAHSCVRYAVARYDETH